MANMFYHPGKNQQLFSFAYFTSSPLPPSLPFLTSSPSLPLPPSPCPLPVYRSGYCSILYLHLSVFVWRSVYLFGDYTQVPQDCDLVSVWGVGL